MLLLPLLVALSQTALAQDPAPAAPAAPAAAPAPALAVSPEPAAPVERVRVLVFDVKPTGGVSKETAENLTGLMAALLSEDSRLEVLAGPDLRSMLELEGQKEALGCESNNSCIAEAAGALNAKYVLVGDAGFLGSLINLNLSLYDQAKATNIGRRAVQAASMDLVPGALRPALSALMVQAIGAPVATPAPVAPVASGPGILPWVTVGVGSAAILAGGALLVMGILPALDLAAEEQKFRNGDASALQRAADIQQASYVNGAAPAMVGVGAALAIVGMGAAVGGVVWAMGAAE